MFCCMLMLLVRLIHPGDKFPVDVFRGDSLVSSVYELPPNTHPHACIRTRTHPAIQSIHVFSVSPRPFPESGTGCLALVRCVESGILCALRACVRVYARVSCRVKGLREKTKNTAASATATSFVSWIAGYLDRNLLIQHHQRQKKQWTIPEKGSTPKID